eukprot:CCRYP_019309-RA/>CCRYP_019309-RA protein AED:0.04 eAED:0.04 QI:88/1/1/1/1/1/2/1276/479
MPSLRPPTTLIMEDRHSISEPRAIVRRNFGSPSYVEWEVDILRDDTVVVDTLTLTDEVLPPRTNKKGKVVWRLPDSEDKLPAFGTEDRRRILEIFKDRKKKRKQEKKKRQDSDGVIDDGGNNSPGKLSRNNSSNEYEETESSGRGGGQMSGPYEFYSIERSHTENLSQEQDGAGYIEDIEVKQTNESTNEKHATASVSKATNGYRRQHSCPAASRPPPGLGDVPDRRSSAGEGLLREDPNPPPDPSYLSINDTQPQYNQQHLSPRILESRQPISSAKLAADALFIVVPRSERPDPLPGEEYSSLAVPAARHFIESYYTHLENTSPTVAISELSRYYTTKAQKSVSIGGAHAVVIGRKDITAQILSLAGSTFIVRGVVAQDTFDGRGVHILITGTAKTVCNAVAGGALAFAHSVSLAHVDTTSISGSNNLNQICPALADASERGYPFQIHNDALAFLSGDIPSPQPSPPLQSPPPPPGLF